MSIDNKEDIMQEQAGELDEKTGAGFEAETADEEYAARFDGEAACNVEFNDADSAEYVLTNTEAYQTLTSAGIFKLGRSQWIRTVLLLCVMGVSIYNCYQDPNYVLMGSILAGMSLLLVALVWFVPYSSLKRRAAAVADGKTTFVRYTGTGLWIKKNDNPSLIKWDDVKYIEKSHNIYIFFLGGRTLLSIPERALSYELNEKMHEKFVGKPKKAVKKKDM